MISTHILDTSKGSPAENVEVDLEKKVGEKWAKLQELKSNKDGRITFDCKNEKGLYRLTFKVESYLKNQGVEFFFASTQVVFNIEDTKRKYHIPLLLNPYGQSVYRGS